MLRPAFLTMDYLLKWTIRMALPVYLDNEDVEQILQETGWDEDGDGFLAPNEVTFSPQDLVEKVNEILQKSPEKLTRMSNQTFLYQDSTDNVYSKIQKRIAEVVSLPLELIKMAELQVVSYDRKGHYNAHLDSSSEDLPCCSRKRHRRCRLCRYMTMMFYLNDVEEGGETAFPIANNITADPNLIWQNDMAVNLYKNCKDSNLLVQPVKGKAVIWYNHFIDESTDWLGDQDLFTLHGGCPVTKGTKWIATLWVSVTTDKYEDLKMMQKFTDKKQAQIKEEL